MNSIVSHLETTDASTSSAQCLYEPPLDMFGADALERWFNKTEIVELIDLTMHLFIREELYDYYSSIIRRI